MANSHTTLGPYKSFKKIAFMQSIGHSKSIKWQVICFLNGPYPASFSLFSSFQYKVDSQQMFNINIFFCQWLDSNRGPLISEVTARTEPQPLPLKLFVCLLLFIRNGIECAGTCLSDSACSGFVWNRDTATCQIFNAQMLAGDNTSTASEGYVDKTLLPGDDEFLHRPEIN